MPNINPLNFQEVRQRAYTNALDELNNQLAASRLAAQQRRPEFDDPIPALRAWDAADYVEVDEVPMSRGVEDSPESLQALKNLLKYGTVGNYYKIYMPASGLYRMVVYKSRNVLLATIDDKAVRINKDYPLLAHKREIQRFAAGLGRSCLKIEFSEEALKTMFKRKQNANAIWRTEVDPVTAERMRGMPMQQPVIQRHSLYNQFNDFASVTTTTAVSVNAFDEILF